MWVTCPARRSSIGWIAWLGMVGATGEDVDVDDLVLGPGGDGDVRLGEDDHAGGTVGLERLDDLSARSGSGPGTALLAGGAFHERRHVPDPAEQIPGLQPGVLRYPGRPRDLRLGEPPHLMHRHRRGLAGHCSRDEDMVEMDMPLAGVIVSPGRISTIHQGAHTVSCGNPAGTGIAGPGSSRTDSPVSSRASRHAASAALSSPSTWPPLGIQHSSRGCHTSAVRHKPSQSLRNTNVLAVASLITITPLARLDSRASVPYRHPAPAPLTTVSPQYPPPRDSELRPAAGAG